MYNTSLEANATYTYVTYSRQIMDKIHLEIISIFSSVCSIRHTATICFYFLHQEKCLSLICQQIK